MFTFLRGGGGYEPINGSDTTSIASQDSFHTTNGNEGDNRSIDSMDLNGDGVVTEAEARQYVQAKLSDRFRNVVNQTPNSVTGHLTNMVLGGALVVSATYIPDTLLDPDNKSKMNIAGMAMLGTGTTGLMSSGFKWAFGKPLQPEQQLPLPNTMNNIHRRV